MALRWDRERRRGKKNLPQINMPRIRRHIVKTIFRASILRRFRWGSFSLALHRLFEPLSICPCFVPVPFGFYSLLFSSVYFLFFLFCFYVLSSCFQSHILSIYSSGCLSVSVFFFFLFPFFCSFKNQRAQQCGRCLPRHWSIRRVEVTKPPVKFVLVGSPSPYTAFAPPSLESLLKWSQCSPKWPYVD